jgi:sulfur-carrier protein adenylyltransferase/sulfurtransferase
MKMAKQLSQEEVLRYSRHLLIPEVGLEGQRKLKNASVLLVGTGGLGSPVALYLAAAGVGTIGIIDYDTVDDSNLQRQVIHDTHRLGELKVESARRRMLDLNPHIEVVAYNEVLSSANAERIAEPYDLIVDGTDNFPTRYLINDLCVLTGKPYVYGSIFRFEGQVSVFDARRGPCYRCLFPEPPPPGSVPSCAEGGVFGVLPGTVGTIQGTEVIKIILGIGEPLIGKLLLYDALDMSFHTVQLRKNPNCILCGTNPRIQHLIDYEQFCGVPTRGTHMPEDIPEIRPAELAGWMRESRPILLLDVREEVEGQISKLPGSKTIPVGMLPHRLGELDREAEIVLYCRTGVRSARAAEVLMQAGFQRVKNLRGGINAWADEVDPAVLKY